ncbi:ribosome maturation factor RimM [Spiroplasma cantharicola]|uniref:Ribosome maturation factor RimM n=1 Tax=Spiroplasma cantharicola TaxID=362837 RepID=A0A0M3SJ67_9MOLU|nr:ribosome maturation factor RimM [Spiroplasma cantharicola]ALD66204.1 16S rRNA processing protein rimM [Spiroplasma cantharicola]
MFNNLQKIGKIVATHGLKGELKFKLESGLILIKEIKSEQFFLESISKNLDVFEVKKSYFLNKKHIIALDNINTIEKAQKLINNTVYVKRESELIEEEFSYIGFECFYQNKSYGKVIDEMFNGAHDLIKIVIENNQLWIPCVDFYLENINLEEKKIYLKQLEVLV